MKDQAWSRHPFVPACARCGAPFPLDAGPDCPGCRNEAPMPPVPPAARESQAAAVVTGGEMLYRAPGRHRCETPAAEAPGSVWRCGRCGTYWRVDALPLMAFAAWHPMGRLAVWRWKRRQGRAT